MIYTWMPLLVFWHVFAQLFLDFNGASPFAILLTYVALYVLISIAVHPQPSTGRGNTEWIAAGGYIACTTIWLLGIVVGYEYFWSYRRLWGRNRRPLIEPLYMSAARSKFAAMRSYSYFGFINHGACLRIAQRDAHSPHRCVARTDLARRSDRTALAANAELADLCHARSSIGSIDCGIARVHWLEPTRRGARP